MSSSLAPPAPTDTTGGRAASAVVVNGASDADSTIYQFQQLFRARPPTHGGSNHKLPSCSCFNMFCLNTSFRRRPGLCRAPSSTQLSVLHQEQSMARALGRSGIRAVGRVAESLSHGNANPRQPLRVYAFTAHQTPIRRIARPGQALRAQLMAQDETTAQRSCRADSAGWASTACGTQQQPK